MGKDTAPGQQKKFDKTQLPKPHPRWGSRAEEIYATVTALPTQDARLQKAMEMSAEDLRDVILNGTKEDQLDAVATMVGNLAPWKTMVLDGK